MYIEFLAPSPKAGQKEHQSREVAAALIAAGFAKPVEGYKEPVDPVALAAHTIPPAPPRGWVLSHMAYGDEPQKLVIVFHDGFGGKQVYDNVPGPRRQWNGVKEGYEMVPSDCPQEIVVQFLQLSGREKEAAKIREEAAREARRNAEEAVALNKGGNRAAIARMTWRK